MTNQTSLVYGKLEHENSVAAHFGLDYANVTVSRGDVMVYISELNCTTRPVDYNDIKLNIGPFVVPALPSQPAMATNLA